MDKAHFRHISIDYIPRSEKVLVSEHLTSPTPFSLALALQKSLPNITTKDSLRLADALFKSVDQEGFWVIVDTRLKAEGGFKKVFKGFLPTQHQVYEVAIVRTKQKRIPGYFKDGNANELIYLRRQIQHPIPGIVSLFLVSELQSVGRLSQFVVVAHLYDSDLYQLIAKHRKNHSLGFQQKRSIQQQLLLSVDHLHKNGIIHGDIKPSNFFVKHVDENVVIELGDLASASDAKRIVKPRKKKCKKIPGSAAFMAPEYVDFMLNIQRESRRFSASIDIWGLGLIFLLLENESIFRDVVFGNQSKFSIDTYQEYYTKKMISQFPEPENQHSMLHLIWEMLQPLPKLRITSQKALLKFSEIKHLC